MTALLTLLLVATQFEVPLVEVSLGDHVTVPPREGAALEDAIALAFNTDTLKVETRRQRAMQTPPAVYFHAQALQACANPAWSKAMVLRCVEKIPFPSPPLRKPTFIRATHQLRLSMVANAEGELLVMTLTHLGTRAQQEQIRRTQIPKDATTAERRAAVLELAGQLLGALQ